MFLNHRAAPRLELMEAHEPDFVAASKVKRQLEKTTFEWVSRHKGEVVTAALVWNTNSYFVDVESQVFVINGGKKIRFEEWQLESPQVFLLRRNKKDLNGANAGATSTVSYMLGLEGSWQGKERMVLMHISADGSQFRFSTTR